MTCWLDQMSAYSENGESHDDYEKEVCERKRTEGWCVRKVRPEGLKPHKGDIIVLFFTWSGDSRGGISGWAEVMEYDEEEETIDFEPKEPSDHLKMKPILDDMVKDITKTIRGQVYLGTMWKIPPDLEIQIRQLIEQV